MKKRIEKDSLGEIQIPFDALYGPQTQRAVENFNFSSYIMPKDCLLYTSPSPRDGSISRMPSSA